jgi:phospho-N-acetylmuramoyl-pentapeptide-transferase
MLSSGSNTLPGQILEFLLTNQAATALTLFVISWFGVLILGPSLIRWLKRLPGMKWSPREDTPDSHLAKSGTPSMGGVGIIGVAAAVYGAFLLGMFLLYAASSVSSGSRLSSLPYLEPWIRITPQFGLFAGCVALHAVLGFIDDWSKAKGRGGLTSRQKLTGQIILSLALVFFAYQLVDPDYQSRSGIRQPWSFGRAAFMPDMDLLFFVEMTAILALVVIATSNAVNLTDGIDGLAAGLAVQCGAAFIFMGWNGWNYWTRESYSSYHFEVTWVWACLAGACLGFLAFNRNPAKVFMGDTGVSPSAPPWAPAPSSPVPLRCSPSSALSTSSRCSPLSSRSRTSS